MPLRDHFRPPVSTRVSWEEIHAMWPARIVLQLRTVLPKGYAAGPKVHAGSQIEIDVAKFESDDSPRLQGVPDEGGVATAVWSPPEPTVAVETQIPDYDEYEVRIYDAERGRQLVAAIELVSPGNKDRPATHDAFVRKCAAYLQQRIGLIVVDVVTSRAANLHERLLKVLQQSKSSTEASGPLYSVAYRIAGPDGSARMEQWSHSLKIGGELPTLPLWIADELSLPLDLEATYASACRTLRIAK